MPTTASGWATDDWTAAPVNGATALIDSQYRQRGGWFRTPSSPSSYATLGGRSSKAIATRPVRVEVLTPTRRKTQVGVPHRDVEGDVPRRSGRGRTAGGARRAGARE